MLLHFSNGQFDVKNKVYVFDPKTTGFVPMEGEVKNFGSLPRDQIFLEYSSRGPYHHDRRCSTKVFTLTLYRNGEIIGIEKEKTLHKSGYNPDYENAVRSMQRKAAELSG